MRLELEKGDKVKFTTKYDEELIGTFEEYSTVPWSGGEKEVYIVIAQPWGGSAGDVRCIVPFGGLEKEGAI